MTAGVIVPDFDWADGPSKFLHQNARIIEHTIQRYWV